MSEYQFTHDWFKWAPDLWTQLTPMLPIGDFLEIGSFEGRSTVWMMEHMLEKGHFIDCVDTWEGGEEHGAEDMSAVEARFDHNIRVAEEKFPVRKAHKFKMTSYEALRTTDVDYAFIYIDGSHIAKDVMTDACMAWPLLKKGGIMVFDDYMWGNPRDILHRPKPAIDAFCNIFAEEAEIVHVGYQLVVRRKGE